LEKKAWKKQLQSTDQLEEKETSENHNFNNFKRDTVENENTSETNSLVGKRLKDFHPSLPLLIDGEWCGHTFASFSHRFYLTTHMSQTTSKAISQKEKRKS